MSRQFRSLALGGTALLLVIGAGQANAADANQIADALVAAMQASGDTKMTYESATADGDNVTITGVSAVNEDGGTITVPTITITNAQPRDNGGFTASAMTFDNGKVVDDDSNVTWATGSLADAMVPSADEIKAKAKIRPFSRVDVGEINIEGSDLPATLKIGSFGLALDINDQGVPRDFDMKIASIDIPPEVFAEDPQQKAVLDELGYTNGFVVNLDLSGAYETEGDILTLRNFALEANDVGKLIVTGKFNGVSMSKMVDGADPSAVTNGSLENLTIRFDNTGIVERGLDMQAKMMGADRETVVAQNAGALPFMLNFIGNPAFQDKVAKAGSAFLNDPQSVTITVMPPSPVAFMEIMGAAEQAPQTLPDMLSVDVTANN